MKSKVRILTPFYRRENLATLRDAITAFGGIWQPLVLLQEWADMFDGVDFPKPHGVFICSEYRNGENRAYAKINRFIDALNREEFSENMDDDYFGFMSDDDLYEANVIPAISKMTADIVFISMKRGDNAIEQTNELGFSFCHPATTLYARSREDIKVGYVDDTQLFVKGRILKQLHWGNSANADGELCEFVVNNFPADNIAYRPDLFAMFNLYQPGRCNVVPEFTV